MGPCVWFLGAFMFNFRKRNRFFNYPYQGGFISFFQYKAIAQLKHLRAYVNSGFAVDTGGTHHTNGWRLRNQI
jgi:hypothetical protein